MSCEDDATWLDELINMPLVKFYTPIPNRDAIAKFVELEHYARRLNDIDEDTDVDNFESGTV